MPRRRARQEEVLVRLPKSGNFDRAIRKYLENNQPNYSDSKLAFALPKDRSDFDSLISMIRITLLKVPIIKDEKEQGRLFRKEGDQTYLVNPLSPARVKHSEGLIDELAERIVTFYLIDADKYRDVKLTLRAYRERIANELEKIFSKIPNKLLRNAETAIDVCFNKLENQQRIEIRKTPRVQLTLSLFEAFNPGPIYVSPALAATSQGQFFKSHLPTLIPKISRGGTLYSIALIYRHLGLEEGAPDKIADRIRKEYGKTTKTPNDS